LRTNAITNVLKGIDIKLAALIVQFLVSIGFSLMGSFLPLFIETDLNYPLIEATYWTGIVQLIASSLYAVTAPFWGSMCDRTGIKKITMVILVANAVVYAGMGASTNITEILIFRGLQGSFGGVSTTMFALVAAIYSGDQLKKAISYQIAAMTLGSLVGPGLGGFLASIVGYRLTLVAASLIFVSIIPVMFLINVPPPSRETSKQPRFSRSDLKAVIPDFVSLILVYACISFMMPIIPWFLEALGIPNEQLLLYTTLTTTLNGLAFAIATPLLPRILSDRKLPLVSLAASGAIFITVFVTSPIHFIAVRLLAGAIQAGIPPFLLGGRGTARRGTTMGILNSARFAGSAVGPFMATSLLDGGEPSNVLTMFATMASLSLLASLVIYLTHKKSSRA
jgi:DHA1 family multidrug resistance protein-like MFS transporter